MTPIDKDELLKALRQRYDNLKQWYKNTTNENAKTNASFAMAECFEIGNIVKEQPTVDAVPVVRCKDCKLDSTEYKFIEELPINETSYYDCGEIKVINELPTINAVPVVKCRDCKFNYANYIPGEDSCFKFTDLPISKDFYCACGEIFID